MPQPGKKLGLRFTETMRGHWTAGDVADFEAAEASGKAADNRLEFTVTVSTDDGKTWSKPAIPPGLLTNNAKVWVQQTSDGRYAMVYNPVGRDRFPRRAAFAVCDIIRLHGSRNAVTTQPPTSC